MTSETCATLGFRMPQEMLQHWEATRPDHVYLRQRIDGRWEDFSWRRVLDEARRVAAALDQLGLQPGDRVGIMSKNCAHWFIADFALMLGGYVSVPIYPTANAKTIRYVLEHSECRACFIGKLDEFEPQRPGIPGEVITISFPYPTMPCAHEWQSLVDTHEPIAEDHRPQPADLMTIIYTSGSTGNPKGAIHSYRSFAFVGTRIGEFLGLREDDRCLSYLPLAHCTERGYIEASSLYHNGQIHFAESLATFADDLRAVRPTFFGSVPRLWKRFQLGVFQRMPERKLQRLLGIPIVGKIVARKVRQGLGLDATRWLASGTAPIAPSLLEWYQRLGMPIREGWGMTETFAYGSTSAPTDPYRLGTIGHALPEAEIRIGAGKEILIRVPSMMDGYYREPQMTAACFDEDGFLKTGDCGEIDEEGYIRITGRAKEIFKTAKGKYVAPVPIESLLAQNPLIEIACVMGLGMPQPVALIQLAESGVGDRELARERLADTLTIVNAVLESHERLDRLVVVRESWTPENGLLTPTLKLKRELIERRYLELVVNARKQVEFEVEHAL